MSEETKRLLKPYSDNLNHPDYPAPDYEFFCPACGHAHAIWVAKPNRKQAQWTFNGNHNKPTFRPSLKLEYVMRPEKDPSTGDFRRGPDGKYLVDEKGRLLGAKDAVCHLFITDGTIQYCPDCTHALAGKTVPMVAF